MTTVLSLGRIQGVPIEFLAEYGGYCKRPERKGCWGWNHRGQFGTRRWPYITGAWDGFVQHLTLFTETLQPEEQLLKPQLNMAQQSDLIPLFPNFVLEPGSQDHPLHDLERSLWEEEGLNPELGRAGQAYGRGRWAEYPSALGTGSFGMPWIEGNSRWGAELRTRATTTQLEEEP